MYCAILKGSCNERIERYEKEVLYHCKLTVSLRCKSTATFQDGAKKKKKHFHTSDNRSMFLMNETSKLNPNRSQPAHWISASGRRRILIFFIFYHLHFFPFLYSQTKGVAILIYSSHLRHFRLDWSGLVGGWNSCQIWLICQLNFRYFFRLIVKFQGICQLSVTPHSDPGRGC